MVTDYEIEKSLEEKINIDCLNELVQRYFNKKEDTTGFRRVNQGFCSYFTSLDNSHGYVFAVINNPFSRSSIKNAKRFYEVQFAKIMYEFIDHENNIAGLSWVRSK